MPAMKNGELRQLIDEQLPSEADFDAFCLDHFPETRRRVSKSMDRIERVSRLIELHGVEAIAEALRKPRSASTSTSAAAQTLFFVPQSLNARFTGRTDTLAELRELLPKQRVVGLWALG